MSWGLMVTETWPRRVLRSSSCSDCSGVANSIRTLPDRSFLYDLRGVEMACFRAFSIKKGETVLRVLLGSECFIRKNIGGLAKGAVALNSGVPGFFRFVWFDMI